MTQRILSLLLIVSLTIDPLHAAWLERFLRPGFPKAEDVITRQALAETGSSFKKILPNQKPIGSLRRREFLVGGGGEGLGTTMAQIAAAPNPSVPSPVQSIRHYQNSVRKKVSFQIYSERGSPESGEILKALGLYAGKAAAWRAPAGSGPTANGAGVGARIRSGRNTELN